MCTCEAHRGKESHGVCASECRFTARGCSGSASSPGNGIRDDETIIRHLGETRHLTSRVYNGWWLTQ